MSRGGSREWGGGGGAVEGIPGSIHEAKNYGRSCMVPGETRSQPGAQSMSSEEEDLFLSCLVFHSSLSTQPDMDIPSPRQPAYTTSHCRKAVL